MSKSINKLLYYDKENNDYYKFRIFKKHGNKNKYDIYLLDENNENINTN